MMRSELRATVSIGLMRPPTSTGIFPKVMRSAPSRWIFGGAKLATTQPTARTKASHGRKRFMREQRAAGGRTRAGDNQIAPANRRRQRYKRRKEIGRASCRG